MRTIYKAAMVGLLACAGVALAKPPRTAPRHATATEAAQTPPMTRLPDWAVPESYDLAIKSDPKQAAYSGTVTIAVDLKKASNYLWLHGKDLKVSSVPSPTRMARRTPESTTVPSPRTPSRRASRVSISARRCSRRRSS